ncbi:MAG: carboxypeptidase-like regulatory domain-containing protein [Planctomycetaceae bacterium]|nr:carboxypeptidase-like regulatory domain-containing protein [Planctomycetaceae bacterium]
MLSSIPAFIKLTPNLLNPMKRIIIPLMLAVLSIAGCTRDDGKPKDLPPLFPCEITITQEEKPLAGATIALESFGEVKTVYLPSGITDERGKAVLSTYGFKGVPVGTYKVTVRKTVIEDVTQVMDSYGDMVDSPGTEYRTVEPKFSNANTTPHELEITNSKKMTQATFDVGKPVKEKKSNY